MGLAAIAAFRGTPRRIDANPRLSAESSLNLLFRIVYNSFGLLHGLVKKFQLMPSRKWKDVKGAVEGLRSQHVGDQWVGCHMRAMGTAGTGQPNGAWEKDDAAKAQAKTMTVCDICFGKSESEFPPPLQVLLQAPCKRTANVPCVLRGSCGAFDVRYGLVGW